MENQNDLIRQCELKAQQWLDSPVYDDVIKTWRLAPEVLEA